LVSLPLIGGGVTLIGNPTAVATPITASLLANYETWLNQEAYKVACELRHPPLGALTTLYTPAWQWHQERESQPPSQRAALILSAVGCGWETSL
ncbi:hypothetical protein MKK64_14375, partial [Methylobacterium sp. E-025]|uniref:hypothetical protein n=1 Tax=Methylobacterium sp. E-025 TaxID=2836561 RepID=UPI001FB87BFA